MKQTIIRELGDGLILRRSSAADAGKLAEFNGNVHRDPGDEGPDKAIAAWVGDLMSGRHPTFDVGDFTLVEDTGTGAIVSCLCLRPGPTAASRLASGGPNWWARTRTIETGG
jgi:hypothetical protein